MGRVLGLIVGIGCLGIAGMLCLFCCIISSRADKYWEEFKKGKEKNDRN